MLTNALNGDKIISQISIFQVIGGDELKLTGAYVEFAQYIMTSRFEE